MFYLICVVYPAAIYIEFVLVFPFRKIYYGEEISMTEKRQITQLENDKSNICYNKNKCNCIALLFTVTLNVVVFTALLTDHTFSFHNSCLVYLLAKWIKSENTLWGSKRLVFVIQLAAYLITFIFSYPNISTKNNCFYRLVPNLPYNCKSLE